MSTAILNESMPRKGAAPRRVRRLALLFLPVLLLLGCAPTATVRRGSSVMGMVELPPYAGPKARIAVARFDDKTAKGYGKIGDGMSVMVVTALVNSNRFIVLERDIIDAVITEQDLGTSGRVSALTAVPAGEIEGAELLLIGSVTEFEPNKFGLGGGFIGLGTLIGSVLLHESNNNIPVGAASYTQSHIAIDVRLVDAATSRILASVSVEATGQDWGGFVAGEVGGGLTRLPLGFGGFQNAATEKAVRKAADMAVTAIASQMPAEYLRHGDEFATSGRVVGYSYVDLPGLSAENYTGEPVLVARSADEWRAAASSLGLAALPGSAPVDFSTRQAVLVVADRQPVAGRRIFVERVVAYGDRVEIHAVLQPPPASGREAASEAAAALRPALLLATDRLELPFRVLWSQGP